MISLKSFDNKVIYLAPHSPMTLALKNYLEVKNVNIKGFIDKNKEDTNIIKIEELANIEFDYIFILSPNHFNAIFQEYSKTINKDKIIQLSINNGKYKFNKTFNITQRDFFYIPKDIECKRNKFVFISKSFISANNKALYLYCIRNNIDTILLTDNNEQVKELKQNNLPYHLLNTKEADYEIAISKFIIFDQGNYTYLPNLHNSQSTVQLWHGVGLKKMSKMNNITYDYFISTSNWTNETNFKNIFNAKEFLNLGYPRNDIFFKEDDSLDLMFCDKQVYEIVKNNNYNKIILYMPTHRENNTEIALDLDRLNKKLQEINSLFIIKLHPFVLEFYKHTYNKLFSNIIFHNANGDIYPLLKYVDILVSDYSSIVYDFLLLNKPIIFYIYDIEDYIKNTNLLFDYNEYSSGIKVKNQDELENSFLQEDIYFKQRKKIKNLFFDEIAQDICSKNIIDKLLEKNI